MQNGNETGNELKNILLKIDIGGNMHYLTNGGATTKRDFARRFTDEEATAKTKEYKKSQNKILTREKL